MNKLFLPFLSFFVLLTSCNTPQKENIDLLIVNATIIDVRSNSLSAGKLIAISGDTIRGIADMENRDEFEAGEIIDTKNKFVMPGLWDIQKWKSL